MVIIVFLITVAACIAIDYYLNRRRQPVADVEPETRIAQSVASAPVGGLSAPEHMRFHPGHTWVVAESDGSVRIGLDDFARRLIGRGAKVELPSVGKTTKQGVPVWTFRRDGQEVPMLSPVDGVVDEINPAVVTNPETITRDPYGEGWIARIRPSELGRNMKNLLSGQMVAHWMDGALDQLYEAFEPRLGKVLADGGNLTDDLSTLFDDDEWGRTCREHFLSDVQA